MQTAAATATATPSATGANSTDAKYLAKYSSRCDGLVLRLAGIYEIMCNEDMEDVSIRLFKKDYRAHRIEFTFFVHDLVCASTHSRSFVLAYVFGKTLTISAPPAVSLSKSVDSTS
jgi:hypothetical protein